MFNRSLFVLALALAGCASHPDAASHAERQPQAQQHDVNPSDTEVIQRALYDARAQIQPVAARLKLTPDLINVNSVNEGKFTDIYLVSVDPMAEDEKNKEDYERWVQQGLKLPDRDAIVRPHFAQLQGGILIGVQVQRPLKELADGVRKK